MLWFQMILHLNFVFKLKLLISIVQECSLQDFVHLQDGSNMDSNRYAIIGQDLRDLPVLLERLRRFGLDTK